MKVLMVLTSHDQLGNTGRKTGFWLEEFAAPYYRFKDAGAEIVIASPKGGQPPLDPKSNEPNFQTDLTRRFEDDVTGRAQLASTVRLDSVRQLVSMAARSMVRWPPAAAAGSKPGDVGFSAAVGTARPGSRGAS